MAGPLGQQTALTLNGINQYVYTPIFTTERTPIVTLELWFNAQGPGVIVNEQMNSDDLQIQWNKSWIEIVGNQVLITVENFTYDPNFNESPTILNIGTIVYGTWYQVTLVYGMDFNTQFAQNAYTPVTGGYLSGYLNGVQNIPTQNVIRECALVYPRTPPDYYSVAWTNREGWAIGASNGTCNMGSGNYFQGQVSEFRIWSIARSQSDIASSWNTTVDPNSPGLIAYYSLTTDLSDNLGGSPMQQVNNPLFLSIGMVVNSSNIVSVITSGFSQPSTLQVLGSVCVDIDEWGNVVMNTCTPNTNTQLWTMSNQGQIKSYSSGQCLETTGAFGMRVIQDTCDLTNSRQIWTTQNSPYSTANVLLQNASNNQCLNINNVIYGESMTNQIVPGFSGIFSDFSSGFEYIQFIPLISTNPTSSYGQQYEANTDPSLGLNFSGGQLVTWPCNPNDIDTLINNYNSY